MEIFLKTIAGIFIFIILQQMIDVRLSGLRIMLVMAASAAVLLAGEYFLRPILDFIRKLQQLGNFDSTIMKVLLKAVGIGILSEIAILICQDTGNSGAAKALQILSGMVIVWLSLPLMDELISLLQNILGALS